VVSDFRFDGAVFVRLLFGQFFYLGSFFFSLPSSVCLILFFAFFFFLKMSIGAAPAVSP